MEDDAVAGGCLCGGVRFTVDPAAAFDAGFCHCSMCRHATGAPVVAWALVRREGCRVDGATLERFRSSPGCVRCFCRVCGGPVLYEVPDLPGLIGVHVAAIDGVVPAPLRPRLHMFADDRVCGLELADALPRFADNRLPHPERRDGGRR